MGAIKPRRQTYTRGDMSRFTIYQPVNLGVFDLGYGSLCGDISIMLNPNPQYLTACVESAYFATATATDLTPAFPGANNSASQYKFEINSIVFMACYAKATKPLDNVKTVVIHEYSVMNKLCTPARVSGFTINRTSHSDCSRPSRRNEHNYSRYVF